MIPHYLGGPSAAAAAAVAATQSCRFQWPFKLCIECALKCATGPLRAVRNLTKNARRWYDGEGGEAVVSQREAKGVEGQEKAQLADGFHYASTCLSF